MITDADGRPVGGSRRVRRPRAVSGQDLQNFGYAAYEQAQGPGLIAIPVECYKFTHGATVFRYTSADRSITLAQLDSGTYTPTVLDRDAIDTTQAIGVRMPAANAVAQLFALYNPISPVALTIYRKHRLDPEEIIIFVGQVVTASFDGPQATLTCAPISDAFRRLTPSIVYQSQCNWNLYGTGCGLNKNNFKDSGAVLAVSGAIVRATVFGTRPAGWYNNGWAELANGDRRFIIDHIGDAITLQSPFPSTLTVGAAIDAYAGCDRSEAACMSKFDNLLHHLGFPRIPSRNPYEGSIV
jgi:uncharacterized phage protein (TIGR02218 family)